MKCYRRHGPSFQACLRHARRFMTHPPLERRASIEGPSRTPNSHSGTMAYWASKLAFAGERNIRTGLAFGYEFAIATQSHAPETRLGSQPLQAEFAGAVRAVHAGPDHAELGFFLIQLHFQNFSGLDLATHALNDHTCAAEV